MQVKPSCCFMGCYTGFIWAVYGGYTRSNMGEKVMHVMMKIISRSMRRAHTQPGAVWPSHEHPLWQDEQLKCKMCPDLRIKPSRCECRSAYEVLLHSSGSTLHQIIWAWSPCGMSGSSAGPNPPSLPVNPSGRRATPTQGSWGRICSAQPWSCMLADRLKRPARTAVRGGAAFCGHVSAVVYIQSINRPSLAHIGASVDRSSRCQSTEGTQGVRGEGWGLQRRAKV